MEGHASRVLKLSRCFAYFLGCFCLKGNVFFIHFQLFSAGWMVMYVSRAVDYFGIGAAIHVPQRINPQDSVGPRTVHLAAFKQPTVYFRCFIRFRFSSMCLVFPSYLPFKMLADTVLIDIWVRKYISGACATKVLVI